MMRGRPKAKRKVLEIWKGWKAAKFNFVHVPVVPQVNLT